MTTTVFVQGTVITHEWLNDVNQLVYARTVQVATEGQTVFSVPTYVLGGRLMVFVNGLLEEYNEAYTETSTSTITFASGLSDGDRVTFRG